MADKHVFYDKLTFIYVEMPKFSKNENELETMFDKWMFALQNLARLLERPAALQERVFTQLFEQAEIMQYTPQERSRYEESLKDYRDLINVVDTAILRKGEEVAGKMIADGLPVSTIIKYTGLTEEAVNKVKEQLQEKA